jgi:hypothetical protein
MAGEVAPGAFDEEELKRAVRELLESVEVAREEYGRAYPELLKAQVEGKIKDLASHWRYHGYFEGRSWD